jgi:3-hydroxybutyryl-CoA dehydrogenase
MVKHLGIVGAGQLGTALAKLAILNKIEIYIYDINETLLRRSIERIKADFRQAVQQNVLSSEQSLAALERLKTRTNLPDLGHCDIIIEAVVEDVRVKKDLFKHLDADSKSATILATTSPSLLVSSIGSAARNTERIIGFHFFGNAASSELVEVIPNINTPTGIINDAAGMIRMIGKVPIIVKDVPGAIVERISHVLFNEALFLSTDQTAVESQIDNLVRQNLGLTLGPFQKMDAVGIDIVLAIGESIFEQSNGDSRFRPSGIIRQMVEAGLTGQKNGKGFYRYGDNQ